MATRLPKRLFTLSTLRRMVASSMTSSWYSEARWTSSTATPPMRSSSVASLVAPGGRGQGQQGSEALAAGGDQVGGDLVQEVVTGHHRGGEQGLETLQSLLQAGQAEGLGRVHDPKR